MTSPSTSEQVRALNDAFRTAGSVSGDWIMTAGVSAKGVPFATAAMAAVRRFDNFTEDNDPYGEHDFGAFELAGEKLFWKLDYYDPDLQFGSDDPADPAATRRVLTIMLASEY